MTADTDDGSSTDWLICGICGQVNNASEDCCDKCGHHLYIFCGICGQQNKRISHRCEKCSAKLGPAGDRPAHSLLVAGKYITRFQLALVILAGLATYLLLAWLVGL